MEVNAGGLDSIKERKKRCRKDNEDAQRKKHKKDDSEIMEADVCDWDRGKEGGKSHKAHESKLNSRHRRDVKKEKPMKYDKHHHCGGRRREKTDVEDRDRDRDRDRDGVKKKYDNRDCEQRKGLERKRHHDTGCGRGIGMEKSYVLDSERWNRESRYKEEHRIHNRSNSEDLDVLHDHGYLDRWVPARDSDEERSYHANIKEEGSCLIYNTQDLKSVQPCKKGCSDEEKVDKKKMKSAWMIEETEKQHLSPVTLSDVEFSTDFDSRITGREFKVAQDYGRLKSEGPKKRKVFSLENSNQSVSRTVEAISRPCGRDKFFRT